jgi:hypothetical protein
MHIDFGIVVAQPKIVVGGATMSHYVKVHKYKYSVFIITGTAGAIHSRSWQVYVLTPFFSFPITLAAKPGVYGHGRGYLRNLVRIDPLSGRLPEQFIEEFQTGPGRFVRFGPSVGHTPDLYPAEQPGVQESVVSDQGKCFLNLTLYPA